MIAYEIYDCDWMQIMGKKQIIEFMTMQILDNFIYEDLSDKNSDLYWYVDEISKEQKRVLEKIFNNKKISFADAKKILPLRDFKIREFNIY